MHMLKAAYRPLVLCLTPLALFPMILISPTKLVKCAFVLLLMAVYWVSEALHLSVTSLLPIILIPLLGIMESDKVTRIYFSNTNMLFVGSLIVARAIEYSNLHKRVALFILLKCGTNSKNLLLGFMFPTWFMSMWINNTAATTMGDSISHAVVTEMIKLDQDDNDIRLIYGTTMSNYTNEESPDDEDNVIMKNIKTPKQEPSKHILNLAKGISLSIAYSASCGGIATLTGTAPNLFLEGLVTNRYGEESGINFGSYMAYSTPISILCLFFTWLWICILFIGPRQIFVQNYDEATEKKIRAMLHREYTKLGPISFSESSCALWLFILIALWVTRNPGYALWSQLFVYQRNDKSFKSFATDTQPAILTAIILLSWPSENPFKKQFWQETSTYSPLLPWTEMQKGLAWSVIFLLGGSFALAEACKVSGLSTHVGNSLNSLTTLPPVPMLILIIIGVCVFTTFTSNTATATIVLPILLSLAECNNINPLYLAMPGTVAASLAFCLPISTPPNAIIYASGHVTIWDMIKCGFLLNIACIFVVLWCTISYGQAIFGMNDFPSWANKCSTINNKTIRN